MYVCVIHVISLLYILGLNWVHIIILYDISFICLWSIKYIVFAYLFKFDVYLLCAICCLNIVCYVLCFMYFIGMLCFNNYLFICIFICFKYAICVFVCYVIHFECLNMCKQFLIGLFNSFSYVHSMWCIVCGFMLCILMVWFWKYSAFRIHYLIYMICLMLYVLILCVLCLLFF